MPGTESGPPLLIYMLKQVELAVRARLDEIVRPAGLTALQYTALSVLERHRDRTDRRRLVVALTDDGRALLDRCRPEVAALEATMLKGLSVPQTKALRTTLATCYANLSKA